MKKLLALLTLFIIVGLPQTQTFGWSGPGHAALAAAAFQELAAESTRREKLVQVLRNHPAFNDWQGEFNHSSNLPTGLDFGTFLFIRASTWPDLIRDTKDPKLMKWDHPNWHFVNYPLRPPTFTTGPNPFPDDDVLAGIKACRLVLGSKNADPVARAVFLSWLIHLVGDIHQPLHCIALIEGPFKPPKGDFGGNSFLVFRTKAAMLKFQQNPKKNKSQATKLHSFWDQQIGAGTTPNAVKAFNDAGALVQDHPRNALDELSLGANVEGWSFESRDQASQDAYRFNGTRIKQKAVLPAGYANNANRIARRRLAISGYRLSDELRKVAF